MKETLTVRVKESFKLYNHNQTELIAEAMEGETLTAHLNKESEEYFAIDGKGGELFVGEFDLSGALVIDDCFELTET